MAMSYLPVVSELHQFAVLKVVLPSMASLSLMSVLGYSMMNGEDRRYMSNFSYDLQWLMIFYIAGQLYLA